MDTHHSEARNRAIIWGFGIALLLTALLSFALGRFPISPAELWQFICAKLFGGPAVPLRMESVLLNIRLPRVLLACMVGCCLSGAGAAYQGIFQNPMASPDVLGASAGAAFGAALAILLRAGSHMIALSAFFFGMVTVALVWTISRLTRGKQVLGLILSGIMISSLASACTSFLKLIADPMDQLPAITYWLMGSLAGARREDVIFAAIPMVIGIVPLLLLRWRLTILTMGDQEARAMGIHATALRLIAITCATLITASAVAVSGTIGWVGLVIPHLSRKLVGNNYRFLMPLSMLFGALFLLLVDNVARNLFATESPLGILTAFIGAPFFIYLITTGGDIG